VEKIRRRSMQESEGGRVVEEGRGRQGMENSRGMPERPGTLSRDRLCHHCRTTMVQKLGKDLLVTSITSFQQGDEPHQSPTSDQEAMCLLFAQGNSRDPLTM